MWDWVGWLVGFVAYGETWDLWAVVYMEGWHAVGLGRGTSPP